MDTLWNPEGFMTIHYLFLLDLGHCICQEKDCFKTMMSKLEHKIVNMNTATIRSRFLFSAESQILSIGIVLKCPCIT